MTQFLILFLLHIPISHYRAPTTSTACRHSLFPPSRWRLVLPLHSTTVSANPRPQIIQPTSPVFTLNHTVMHIVIIIRMLIHILTHALTHIPMRIPNRALTHFLIHVLPRTLLRTLIPQHYPYPKQFSNPMRTPYPNSPPHTCLHL